MSAFKMIFLVFNYFSEGRIVGRIVDNVVSADSFPAVGPSACGTVDVCSGCERCETDVSLAKLRLLIFLKIVVS